MDSAPPWRLSSNVALPSTQVPSYRVSEGGNTPGGGDAWGRRAPSETVPPGKPSKGPGRTLWIPFRPALRETRGAT